VTRAVAFGVLAYLLHWLFLAPAFLLVDLTRPLPLTLGGS